MSRLRATWSAAIVLALISLPQPTYSAVFPVSSLAELGANDSISWGQLGAVGTVVLDPVTTNPPIEFYDSFGPLTTTNGLGVGAGARGVNIPPHGTTHLVVDELGGLPSLRMAYGEGDAFRPPSALNGQNIFLRALLTFDQPILGFGADIFFWQQFPSGGNSFARIEARDANGVFLGQALVFSSGAIDQFLGLQSDSIVPDIKTVEILGWGEVNQNVAARGILEIGQAGLLTAASTSAVPEPSALALFGLGTIALAGHRRRQKRA